MIIIWWWCSKPITEAIGTLGSFPLLFYIIYHSNPCFSSCPPSPSVLLPLRTSPPPRPTPPPLSPSPSLSQSLPAPTTSKKPRLPSSEQISHIGPESVASQYIVQPYSASVLLTYVSPPVLLTSVFLPEAGNPISCLSYSMDASH